MSANTTIYPSAPFIRTGSVAPTARLNPYEQGMPQVYETFAEQGHPGTASNKLKMFEPFFGVSPGGKDVQENYYQKIYNWQQENYTLPDAYVGQNLYILNILITAIFIADQWPVTRCLPWLKKEDSMEVQWTEWHFTDHMLDRSPEETVPRMLTNTRTSHSKGMQRYGKNCSFEDGFLTTPMGRVHWAMSIKQIYNLIIETACMGACVALIQSSPAIDHLAEFRGSGNNQSDTAFIRGIMDQAELMFAPHKRFDGMISLLSRAITEYTNRNGKGPNGLILPQGTSRYFSHLDHNTPNLFKGPHGSSDIFRTATSGLELLESREFRIGEHEDNLDVFYKEIAFGGVFVMNDRGSKTVQACDYKTAMRNTAVYDESVDDYVMVEFGEAMKYSGLWTNLFGEDEPELAEIGQEILPGMKSQWKILQWGGQDKAFLECILSLKRHDTMKRFLELAKYRGLISEDESNDIYSSTVANNPESAMVYQANNLNQGNVHAGEDEYPVEENAFEAFWTFPVKIGNQEKSVRGWIESSKSKNRDQMAQCYSAESDLPITIHVTNSEGEHTSFNYANSKLCYRFDGGKMTSGHIGKRQDVIGEVTSSICPLQINTDQFNSLFSVSNSDATELNSVQIKAPEHMGISQLGYLWLNVFLSIYLVHVEKYKQQDYDRVQLLNRIYNTLILLQGNDEYNSFSILPALVSGKTNKHIEVYSVATGDLRTFVSRTVKVLLKSHNSAESGASNREIFKAGDALISKSQQSASASADQSHSKLVNSAHIQKAHGQTLSEELQQEGIQWSADVVNVYTQHASGRQLEDLRAEVLSLFYLTCHRINELISNDIENARMIVLGKLKTMLISTRKNWFSVRSLMFDVNDFDKMVLFVYTSNIDDTDVLLRSVQREIYLKSVVKSITYNSVGDLDSDIASKLSKQMMFIINGLTNGHARTTLLKLVRHSIVYIYGRRANGITDQQEKDNLIRIASTINKYNNNNDVFQMYEMYINNFGRDSIDELSDVIKAALLADVSTYNGVMKHVTANTFEPTDISISVITDPDAVRITNKFVAVFMNYLNSVVSKTKRKVAKMDMLDKEKKIIQILDTWDPTDGLFIRFCLERDLPVGFGLCCYRSHMTYLAGTAIIMDLNGAAGNTFFGHANFMIGKDVQKKMTMGSFHMYCASVVTKPTLVQQIPCVISKKYICGNDTRFWDVTRHEHIEAFTSGDLDIASIAPMIIPANWETTLPFWDRTGKFGSTANVSRELEEKADLPFAYIYNEKWHLDRDLTTSLLASIKQPPKCNTRCFRDLQFYYNGATGMYDTVVKNKGPWGERVMPGCGKVRSGYAMHLEIPNYLESKTLTFGV